MYVEERERRFFFDTPSSISAPLWEATPTHPNIARIGDEYRMDAAEIMSGALSLEVELSD